MMCAVGVESEAGRGQCMLTSASSVGPLERIVQRVLLPGRQFVKARARTVCSNVSTRQLCNRPAVSLWASLCKSRG